MTRLPLGKSPVSVSRIGLGGALFGREVDETTSRAVLDHAFENGISLIDTAETYGGGNARLYRKQHLGIDDEREVTGEMHSSEKIIGRWLEARGCRDRIQICTKVSTGGTAREIHAALDASLERLRTDYVDIYMLHHPFPNVPIRESLEALSAELQAGRIRSLGCSNFNCTQLREAQETAAMHNLARFEVVQPPFSLADPAARNDLLPYCHEHSVATITYSPLAAGFLSGKYTRSRDQIPAGTRFDIIPGHIDVYFSEQNFRIAAQLRALSAESGLSMTSLAMAWVFNHPGVTSVLVGARKRSHLDNALQALAHPLDAAWLARMHAWLDPTPPARD